MVDMLTRIVGRNNIFQDEPLKKHSTFGIGGNAYFYIKPTTYFDMFEVISELGKRSVKWKIIGNGSNLLFSDDGYDGVIFDTSNIAEICNLGNGRIIASSGVQLSALSYKLAELELSGLEFASGIPATVGGAVFMNAGAFGKAISDIVQTVTYFNGQRVVEAYAKELKFSYRHSIFQENTNFIIMYSEFNLKHKAKEIILEEMKNNKKIRAEKQPVGKSAGSVFKAVENMPAGKLIDECGLRGLSVGDAIVSDKHANFILNKGGALANDVLTLVQLIKEKVYAKYNKKLELEIEIVR